jgi:predicted RNase H-like HicB family nuclease
MMHSSCYHRTHVDALHPRSPEALKRARFKTLDDGTCFGEIPGLAGVWANEATRMGCREVLEEVLEEWLIINIRDNDPNPPASAGSVYRSRPPE